jgi:hypothetical protein
MIDSRKSFWNNSNRLLPFCFSIILVSLEFIEGFVKHMKFANFESKCGCHNFHFNPYYQENTLHQLHWGRPF